MRILFIFNNLRNLISFRPFASLRSGGFERKPTKSFVVTIIFAAPRNRLLFEVIYAAAIRIFDTKVAWDLSLPIGTPKEGFAIRMGA